MAVVQICCNSNDCVAQSGGGRVVVAAYEVAIEPQSLWDPTTLQTLLLGAIRAHCGPPHQGSNHLLDIVIDGLPFEHWFRGSVTVEIECMSCIQRRRATVHPSVIGLVAIKHHAEHEGHPFKAWINGVEVVLQ